MGDKAKLKRVLLQDMKHWSVETLTYAIRFIDNIVLSQTDDFLWWWDLRKRVGAELVNRKNNHEH